MFNIFNSHAQVVEYRVLNVSKIENDTVKKTHLKFSTSYLNNYIFNGRKDSITTPYFIPAIGYFNKNGFNANLSGYILNLSNNKKFDFLSLDVNYFHEFNDRFSAGLITNKTFYNNNSSGFNNNIKGLVGTNAQYDLDYFTIYVEAEVLFFQKKDYSLNIDISRDFEIELKNSKLKIEPAFDLNFCTQHYFEYNSTIKRQGKKNILKSTTDITTAVNNDKFKLLDYEFSIPISFETHNFTFFATPIFAIPTNTIKTTDTKTLYLNGVAKSTTSYDSTSKDEIDLKPNFFIEFGVFYKFNL
ncbi:MAG: hypothetical protein H7174_04335 [Flavobacterium sp.]|nr:hypothetical protein [Flavobacterium sp.]